MSRLIYLASTKPCYVPHRPIGANSFVPNDPTSASQTGTLAAHWRRCRTRPGGMPSYEAVVLGRLGRLADRCALLATREGRAVRLLWGGPGFAEWLEGEVRDQPLEGVADEVRRPIEEIVLSALRSGEPAAARCDRITDGVVTTWNLSGVPLAHGGGAPLVLVHVDPDCMRTDLAQAMFGATGQGLMALGTIRDAEGAIADFKIVALNQGAASLFGRDVAALQWKRLGAFVPPGFGVTGILAGVVGRTERAVFELAFARSEGSTLHLKVEARAIGDLIAVAMTDVGDIKAREASFRLLFDDNPLPMWLLDPASSRFLAVNEAAIAHYGFSREAFLTRRLSDLTLPEAGSTPARSAQEPSQRRQRRADGSTIDVTLFERSLPFEGRPALLGAAIDMTDRRRAEARITHMAHHDALTGLPNRVLFATRLAEALEILERGGPPLSLLCLDLDKFKFVNDSLGHSAGDALLREAARRIGECLRAGDLVARLGGDEFAVLLTGLGAESVCAVATRIIEALGRPFRIEDQDCHIGVSIGIATPGPGEGRDDDTLLRNADLALYSAKASGGGVWRRFEVAMEARTRRRRRQESDLREALARDELFLAYQPIVESRTRRIVGFEALVRWRHPEQGPIPPSEFVPLAEETGLIGQIGAFVLQRACAEAATWPADIRVAVNLSPVQFRDRSLARRVAQALAESGLHPTRLELEVTESILLAESEANVATLHALRALGVRIAMDDFGTGYSSLSYLRTFPFDKIKIDRSFVAEIEASAHAAAIVKAAIGLGASLGIDTVAEGVETLAQYERLRAEGCDAVQGYLFGQPMTPADARAAILNGRVSLLKLCA
jgi:diguanylate cyclase (GGDEF)-like protein/PAS domain S-box-containing protein